MLKLRELLTGLQILDIRGDMEKEIGGVQYDSRQVSDGDLFVCIPGFKTDGHNFVPQALKAGAAALLVEKEVGVEPGPAVVRVPDTRKALPVVAANFFRRPSREIRVIGVTGTNGKTTTTHLITSILEEAGFQVGLLGTLYARWGGRQETIPHTTPESVDVERFCRQVVDGGGSYLVMEVSSHALDLGRVDCMDFNAAIFTNLTQDHLDYHANLDEYRQAKLRLFRMVEGAQGNLAVINYDDASCPFFIEASKARPVTYGLGQGAGIRATGIDIDTAGSRFIVTWKDVKIDVNLKLAGLFNVYNSLAAAAFALEEGIDPQVVKRGLEKVAVVPGRFESVTCGQDFAVIVDYAHTPDGLENILRTARQVTRNRIITVFGCGGDRDRTKRPLMGEIAARYSDFCIVTSDNPRSEEPMAIIEDILPGVNKVEKSRYSVVVDRREAIHQALYLARKGDMVVIAGKGHENYQLVKGKVLPFDDREVARDFLKRMAK